MYKNAPLVEVIAEIKWRLIPIRTLPNAGADPHFETLEAKLLPHLKDLGYNHVQRLTPPELPLEMLAHTAIYRCRTAQDKWPLIQFGPGVVSANVVPPYDGWDSFWPVVKHAIASVFSEEIHGSNKPKIESIVVRYIDAFTSDHGVEAPQRFMKDHLTLAVGMPKHVTDSLGTGADSSDIGMHQSFNVTEPNGATCLVQCRSGAVNDKLAVILDTQISSQAGASWSSETDVAEWVREAKRSLKKIFEAMISNNLRAKMKPEP